MNKPKKKKNSEAQLLFPHNQKFLDGNAKYAEPINANEIMDAFASRHHLSTFHDAEKRVILGFVGILSISIALCSFHVILTSISDILDSQSPVISGNSVPIMLLFIFLACIVIVFICLRAINYQPKRVNRMYQDWLKESSMINGRIIHISKSNIQGYIQYEMIFEGSDTMIGNYRTKSRRVLSNYHIGDTIYILYADKKLHAPL